MLIYPFCKPIIWKCNWTKRNATLNYQTLLWHDSRSLQSSLCECVFVWCFYIFVVFMVLIFYTGLFYSFFLKANKDGQCGGSWWELKVNVVGSRETTARILTERVAMKIKIKEYSRRRPAGEGTKTHFSETFRESWIRDLTVNPAHC